LRMDGVYGLIPRIWVRVLFVQLYWNVWILRADVRNGILISSCAIIPVHVKPNCT
jgi:hypothetical protein